MVQKKRQCTQAFLISEAAPKAGHEHARPEPGQEIRDLSEAFPDAAIGQDFIKACLKLVDSLKAFGALAVKIDDFNSENPGKALLSAARAVDRISRKSRATWGLLESGVFGLCLPDADAGACIKCADLIRASARRSGRVTVSVGAAVYPFADFEKKEIFENIIKALDHAGFLGPDIAVAFDAVSLNVSGDKLYQDKDVDGAIREFTRALLLDQDNMNVHNSLGVCFAVRGQIDSALTSFGKAARLDPTEVMPVYNTGLAHLMQDKKEKALEFFFKANELESNVFEVLLQTGKLLIEFGKTGQAVKYLEKSVCARPDAWTAYKYLGDSLDAQDRQAQAAKAYEKAVKLNPNDAESLSGLGRIYANLGENLDIALAFGQQSVDLAPKNGLFRFRLAELFDKRKEPAKAVIQYKKALELGHPCREAVVQAKERLKKAIKLDGQLKSLSGQAVQKR